MTIVVNGQSIESDDIAVINGAIRDARKAEAAERRARIKAEKEREANVSKARQHAESVAYGLYAMKHREAGFPSTYQLFPIGHRFSPAEVTEEYPEFALRFGTHQGTAFWKSFSLRALCAVGDAGGCCRMVFLCDRADPSDIHGYAVGAHNGVAVLVDCPGFSADDFEPYERPQSA